MAASAASMQASPKDQGWPRWVASLADGAAADVPGHRRIALGRSDAPRRLNLFCELGQSEPRVAASANCALVFEGFLYNGAELAEELAIAGRLTDDASILLEAYRRWGEEFLDRLRGIFALLLWDGDRDIFLCVRDALGNHPLFFGKGSRELVVSTSLDAVVRHPAISPELNRPAIANYFMDSFPKLGETFYADIERIPPGCALRACRGAQAVYRYWDPHRRKLASGWITEDETGLFDDLLSRAVERFFDFGPLGIYLSGGLDSVSIAAIATDLSSRRGVPPPHALSLIFPTEANEESVQKAVGTQLGLAQDLVPFRAASGDRGVLAPVLELSARMSQPLQNYYLGVYNCLAGLGKRRGCRAILTGNGGDEWLGVSPLLAADLLRDLDFRGLYTLWHQTQRSFRPRPFRHIAPRLIWNFGLRTLLRDRALRTLDKLSPSALRALRRRRLRRLVQPWQRIDSELWREVSRRAEAVETDRTREPAEYGAYIAESRRGLDHPLVSWDLEEVFENGKQLGVRFLQPYMDAELVEMLYRTPPALLNRGGLTKGLVRETVAKRFPGLGFDRQRKIDLIKFFPSIMRTEGPAAWRSMGGAKTLVAMGLADRERINSWVQTVFRSDDHPVAFRLWLMMTMESWLRERS
jgi:asparagine synthetase B (glutamine-hydrolysing)